MNIYDKFIVPLWKAFQETPARISLLVVGAVLLIMAVLAFLQFVLGIDIGELFRGGVHMLRVGWNS